MCSNHTIALVGSDKELDQPVIPAAPVINQQPSDALLFKLSPFEKTKNLLEPTKSFDTICQSVGNLSNEVNYSLRCHHIAPLYIHGVILLIQTLYNAVRYSIRSFKVDLMVKILIGMVLRMSITLMGPFGDMEVKVLVTPTSQQLE